MVNGEAGKGDTYRKVNRKKYHRNYLRAYGKTCNVCKGKGTIGIVEQDGSLSKLTCRYCEGLGYVEKK